LKSIKSDHGGARAGSGRKKGAATVKTRAIADKLAADGEETPLEFMLRVMRDPGAEPAHRMDMAKNAAPYIHARLSSIDAKHSGNVGLVVEIMRFANPAS